MTDSSRTSAFGNLKQNLSRFVRSPHVTQVPATTRTSTPAHPASYRTPRRRRVSSPPTKHSRANTAVKRPELPDWLRKSGLAAWALIGIMIIVAAVVYALARVTPVFIAVFVALVVTAILNPVVNFLSRFIPRGLSVVLTLLGFFGIFAGLMALVVNSVMGQWTRLANQFSRGLDVISDFLSSLPFDIKVTPQDVSAWMNDMIAKGQQYVQQNWSRLASDLLSNVSAAAITFTIAALGLFITIFFLLSGERMWRWFLDVTPARRREPIHRAALAGWDTFSGYARGTMIVAATDGLLAGIFLQILGVPVAPALGVLVFIGAFIPLIGAPAAMIIAMIVAAASGGLMQAAIVGLGIAGIGQLEGHVLQPLIMGKQVSLHPVVVGVGVTVGTLTAGLLGAVIAIPIIGVIWSVFSELYERDAPIEDPLPERRNAPDVEEEHENKIGTRIVRFFRNRGDDESEADGQKTEASAEVS